MNHVTLPLYNLGFRGAHAGLAERALTQLPGVVRAYVCSETEMAYIEYEAEETAPASIQEALTASGFGAPLAAPVSPPRTAQAGAPAVRLRTHRILAVAGALLLLLSGTLLVVSRGGAAWAILLVVSGAIAAVVLLDEWRLPRREQEGVGSYHLPTESMRGTHTRRDRWL